MLAGGRRARTIRRRVLGWKQAGRLFAVFGGVPWPASVTHFLDYLQCVASSGAGTPALGRAVHDLAFMERAGNVPAEVRISENALVKAAVDEYGFQAASLGSRPTRQAPQVPLAVIAEFERVVVSRVHPTYVRMFAWYRLVRIWSSMRFDDHRGSLPTSMRIVCGSLRGALTRTNTSGQGKK